MRRRPRAVGRAVVATIAATLALIAGTPARAAHPLISEDPGTQGPGGVELETGFAASRGEPGGGRGAQLAPQLAWGMTETIDVLLVPRYLWLHPQDEARRHGVGDTALDVKWRFVETEVVEVAVRAGLELPTGSESKGLGEGGVGWHAVLAMSVAWGPTQVLANLGYVRSRTAGDRSHQPFVSMAWMLPAEGTLRTFVEVAAQANGDPERSTWPAVARTGLLWRVNDRLDLDVGIEGRLNHAAPRAAFLAGATFHW